MVSAAMADLGRPVVGLTDVALEPGRRHRVDDGRPDVLAGLGALAPADAGELGDGEGALEVHPEDRVEVVLGHRHDHLVPDDAGVVDQDVVPAEGVVGRGDQVLGAAEVGHVVVVGHRLAAPGLDHLDHLVGGPLVGALAARAPAQVVDDHLGALSRQLEGFAPADPVARPGHDRDLAVQNAHETPNSREKTDTSVTYRNGTVERPTIRPPGPAPAPAARSTLTRMSYTVRASAGARQRGCRTSTGAFPGTDAARCLV